MSEEKLYFSPPGDFAFYEQQLSAGTSFSVPDGAVRTCRKYLCPPCDGGRIILAFPCDVYC